MLFCDSAQTIQEFGSSIVTSSGTSCPVSLASDRPTRHLADNCIGLTATFVERPLDVQQQLSGKIPADHLGACKAGNMPTAGNAAGNTVDLFDLRGENKSPGRIPAGFTARGIVALVFSILAAFLGMATIGWYGLKPIKSTAG